MSYRGVYTACFDKRYKTFQSMQPRIEKVVEQILSNPYERTERLTHKSGFNMSRHPHAKVLTIQQEDTKRNITAMNLSYPNTAAIATSRASRSHNLFTMSPSVLVNLRALCVSVWKIYCTVSITLNPADASPQASDQNIGQTQKSQIPVDDAQRPGESNPHSSNFCPYSG